MKIYSLLEENKPALVLPESGDANFIIEGNLIIENIEIYKK